LAPAGAGALLALAYPDRIAQRRAGPAGRFLLSGGQGAWLPEADPLAAEKLLVVADLDGQPPDARIRLATPLDAATLDRLFAQQISETAEIWFELATRSVQARYRRRLGALILAEAALADPEPEAVTKALLDGIRRTGLAALPWSREAETLRARIAFLARLDGKDGFWPAVDDAGLTATLDDWLGPALIGRRSLADLAGLDLARLLQGRLDPAQRRDLERRAPSHWVVPSGSNLPIDYRIAERPVLAVRLQELFGAADTPAIAEGRVPLTLELLSPAGRPIQVTQDLGGFWRGSYRAVRADLRGRYPRHPWPEDPLQAMPTARAKPRGT
jgi:ATP-dependent helicase HrpB